MSVRRIESDADIVATRDVMLQLRPHLTAAEYVATVRRMVEVERYRLAAAIDDEGIVRAVAGYRIFETLYCRRLLSVDDLVTDEHSRSAGYGKELLDWLKAEARAQRCEQVHLDSLVHRERAHRFYYRERFAARGFHFVCDL